MNIDEANDYLSQHGNIYEYQQGEYEGQDGLYIHNKRFDTEIHVTVEALNKLDIDSLAKATHCGRNVDQITRVTGFFSKVSGWNKGKIGELKNRHRSNQI